MLKNQVKINQKKHLDLVDKIESLYDRLRLDMTDKYKFLSLHQVSSCYFLNFFWLSLIHEINRFYLMC